MKFYHIGDVLEYLINSTETKSVEFSYDKLSKTRDILTKFVHNPRLTNPEVRSYDTDSLREHKKRHPFNKVVNDRAFDIVMFNFDENLVYFLTFGDIYREGLFKIEVDVVDMETSEIKSDTQAIELLEEYNKEVPYDHMNDSWDYSRTYQSMKDRKYTRNSEIVRMFQNFTI